MIALINITIAKEGWHIYVDGTQHQLLQSVSKISLGLGGEDSRTRDKVT